MGDGWFASNVSIDSCALGIITQVGSKSEASGISRNPYWEEILMTKLLDICLACLAQNSGRCVWS